MLRSRQGRSRPAIANIDVSMRKTKKHTGGIYTHTHINIYIHPHIHIYIHIRLHACCALDRHRAGRIQKNHPSVILTRTQARQDTHKTGNRQERKQARQETSIT